jgi:hypothetical protein
MEELDRSLKYIESLMKNSFKDAIVWDQKGTGLIGKYLYLNSDSEEVGLFMGYVLGQEGRAIACVSFIFPHPTSGLADKQVNERLFYKLLIRSNLKLENNLYRIVKGRKLPALVRTLSLDGKGIDEIEHQRFFNQAIEVITHSQIPYTVLTK